MGANNTPIQPNLPYKKQMKLINSTKFKETFPVSFDF